ncbi:CYTH domain-containing protein [Mangrovicoccus ximenensis]|uniref:CYTH domain-containing protein n=1 Tax=Mangrovicoccus ximenensis TaxID=1911570 RepID=UPI000D3C16A6|nr:CYTH domain-containing protein [Mangrovicoccus ximenensis]
MATEIERKFLVTGEGWRQAVTRSVALRDGILALREGRKIRIRFYDGRATLTVKGPRNGICRDEFEYGIPAGDARILLESHCTNIREKIRHHVFHGGWEWVVDVYGGALAGVVLAEIELPSDQARFPCPPWIGREVTGLPDFRPDRIAARLRQAGDGA